MGDSNYIYFQNNISNLSGDTATMDRKFKLDKPFCPEEIVSFIKSFLSATFEDEVIEIINKAWNNSEEELEDSIESFYEELEADIEANPEDFGPTQEDIDRVKNSIDTKIHAQTLTKKDKLKPKVVELDKFKEQINNNPDFLKTVFSDYLSTLLED